MKFSLFILILFLTTICMPSCNSPISKNKFCDPASESFKFELLYRLYRKDNSAYCFFGAGNPTVAATGTGVGTGTGTTPLASTKDITDYSIPSLGVTGIIAGTEINLFGESYSTFVPEIATFTTTGSSVKIGVTPQVSGTTSNNFSSTLTYIVTAADSSTKTYTVKLYAPLTISSSNLKAWFKGNSLALANGANVNSWTDSSGTGNTVTTGSNFPTFVASSINGMPAVSFTGIDHNLRRNTGSGLTTTLHSIFVVAKPIVGSVGSMISIGSGGCGVDKVLNIDNTGTPAGGMCNVIALGSISVTIISNTYNIFSVSYINNAPSNLFLNGTLAISATPSNTAYSNNADIAIGKRLASNAEFFNGQIAEVMYFDTNLSTPNIQALQCYLSKKYAIAVSHPCN